MRKLGFIYKYIDQFSFSLLNVGTIVFISKYLASDLAAKYILINTYASFSLIVIVALIITPFWVYSSEDSETNFNFGVISTLFLSFLTGIGIVIVYLFHQNVSFNDVTQILSISISYPLYDFLRRTLYVKGKESVSAITTFLLTCFVCGGYFYLHYHNYQSYIAYVYLLSAGLFFSSIFIYFYSLLNYKIDAKKSFSSIRENANKYFLFGRWSAASMICFWMATQGVFIYLYGKISDQEIVLSKLCLSLTGIISIYFASIENKIMPKLRSAVLNADLTYIKREWSLYRRNGFVLSVGITAVLFLGYVLYYGYSTSAMVLFLLFSAYQIITGVFKYYAYVLKSAQHHKVTFYSNLLGLLATLIAGLIISYSLNYSIALIVLFNGIFCSLGYFYFIKKYGVMSEKHKIK